MHLQYHTIATHCRTDSDELTAIWMALRFGKQFPDKVKIEFYNAGTRTHDGKPVEGWMSKGFFPIGIWGGPCDEHRCGARPRRRDECAATLMAKFLGISEDPKLKPILKYIFECDYGKREFEADGLSVLVKTLHWFYSTEPRKVMDWFFAALNAKYDGYGGHNNPDNFSLEHIRTNMRSLAGSEEAEKWSARALDAMNAQNAYLANVTPFAFVLNGEVRTVPGPCGKAKVAIVSSDDELIWRYATTKPAGRCDVLIQKKSTGNVQIFSNKHRGVYLYNIVPIVREAEMAACGRHSRTTVDLKQEGSDVYGAENWCFMHGIFLFNGSLTAPNVKPTKLTLEQVFHAVAIGLAVKPLPRRKAA